MAPRGDHHHCYYWYCEVVTRPDGPGGSGNPGGCLRGYHCGLLFLGGASTHGTMAATQGASWPWLPAASPLPARHATPRRALALRYGNDCCCPLLFAMKAAMSGHREEFFFHHGHRRCHCCCCCRCLCSGRALEGVPFPPANFHHDPPTGHMHAKQRQKKMRCVPIRSSHHMRWQQLV